MIKMEILNRNIKLETTTIEKEVMQISFNSWGHLTIRFFDREKPEEDILIILTHMETLELMRFVNEIAEGVLNE